MENGDLKISLHIFLISALNRDEWVDSEPIHFTPSQKTPSNPMNKRLDGPETDLDLCENLESHIFR
jgi:hypothetical protein